MQKLFYPIRDNSDVGISRSSSYTLTTQRKNTASSMTKGEIAEFTDFGVRSRCFGINVYLNADVRKHALLTTVCLKKHP